MKKCDIDHQINELYNDTCSCLHNSVSECLSNKQSSECVVNTANATMKNKSAKTKRSWWTQDCKTARNRNRLCFYLWKSSGRPTEGAIYENYKKARKLYRKTCRQAIKSLEVKRFSELDYLCRYKRSKLLWNKIKSVKKSDNINTSGHISINRLEDYFSTKFAKPQTESDYIKQSWDKVHNKLNLLKNENKSDICVSQAAIRKYINQLNNNIAPGLDGIKTEHIKYAMDSLLVMHLSILVSLCVIGGVVPKGFCQNVLTPILKKNNLDPEVPKNYRPIIVSSAISKILELYIMDQCQGHEFSKCQYGFIQKRGTSMGSVMVNDVSQYCINSGSPSYMCSLDAEAAFDGIPHAVLLCKTMNIIPDPSWKILCYWYTNMSVRVKWECALGRQIPIERGTKQGGLSSPMVFNIVYQGLVETLNAQVCGVTIGKEHYNVFSYADDLLLCSLTITGLQKLIDIAAGYIQKQGLNFNVTKTKCLWKQFI